MPHLFLEGRYEEYMVPKGLPGDGTAPNQIVETDPPLAKDELESYLDVWTRNAHRATRFRSRTT